VASEKTIPAPRVTLPNMSFSVGLALLVTLFSAPVPGLAGDDGVAFPLSVESLRARFIGLFGEVLERADTRIGLGRRTQDRDFFALGGKGTASGDVEVTAKDEKVFAEVAFDGESGEGERGDLGVGDGDAEVTRRKAGPLEGERESDRRSCRMAEVAST
jgi:hypothetical protein